jgi:hypothetical protein
MPATFMYQEDKQLANWLNLSPLERSKIEKQYGGAAAN